ncbi:hypothetical protein GOODEAATRI_008285 [Goodea atripinnis]|uniref:Small G protein signalling modulator 1/2 Rab-binding domain-containing protein n=1 Tax=Goodea atripinnis TaxID=208336 RepID=A0ABV0P5A4_9TELE
MWLHGSEEEAIEAFERALGSVLQLEDLHTLWMDYLQFSCSPQTLSVTRKLFPDLVHRCLSTLPSRLELPFNPAQFWSCYDFHNKVVSLYLRGVPLSQRALVLERLRNAMPNNTELGLRLLHQELLEGNMEQLKFQARMLTGNTPRCLSSWRIAIAVERELKERGQVSPGTGGVVVLRHPLTPIIQSAGRRVTISRETVTVCVVLRTGSLPDWSGSGAVGEPRDTDDPVRPRSVAEIDVQKDNCCPGFRPSFHSRSGLSLTDLCPLQVIFEHDGIFLHPSPDEGSLDQDLLVSGFLRILEKDSEILVEYRPLEDSVDPSNILCAGQDSSSVVEWAQCPREKSQSRQLLETQQSYETEWDMVNAVSFRKKNYTNGEGSQNHSHERSRWAFSVNISDLRSITVKDEGWTFLILQLKDSSSSLPALHFHQGGSREFLDSLRRFALLTECPEDETCLLVSTPNKALSQSFENLLDDNSFGLIHKFKRDPYVTTLGGFSKVTNYIYDALRGTEEQQQRPPEEVADLLGEVIPGLEINQQEEPGFEVITRVRSSV